MNYNEQPSSLSQSDFIDPDTQGSSKSNTRFMNSVYTLNVHAMRTKTLNSFMKVMPVIGMILLTAVFTSVSPDLFAQCDTCTVDMVANGNNDLWSDECYLNDNCAEQGNPCQANDVNLVGAFIALENGDPPPTCMPGEMVTVALWGQFINGTNTDRYAVRTTTEVLLDGSCDTVLNNCSFDLLPPGDTALALLGTITYICGESVQLRNTWIAWETSAAVCEDVLDPGYISMCGEYSPSKCSKELGLIDFLSVNFDFACGELTETTTEVIFMDLTTGIMGDETIWEWDFGDGNMSNLQNPTHVYTNSEGPTFEVVLTVFDIIGEDTIQAGATLTVDLDNLGCCALVIECPDPTPDVLSCIDDVPAPTNDSITILDMCGIVDISINDVVTGGLGCVDDTLYVTRTYTIVDDMIHTETCVQVFKIVDEIPPTLSCPADVTIECDDDSSPLFTGMPTNIDDNCSSGFGAIFEDDVTMGVCTTTILRTWTVMDDCGNVASCVQEITITDTTPPMITTCPPDATVEGCDVSVLTPSFSDAGAFVTLTEFGDAGGGASDNCGLAASVFYEDDVTGDCPLTVTRVWYVVDDCNNTASCTQTIVIEDTTEPTFDQACPVDATVSCNEVPTAPVLTASDNCGDATVTFTEESTLDEDGPCGYTITRTWVAVDDCGNSMTCSQVLTVLDDLDPVCPVPPGPIQVACVDDVPPPPSLTATDECQGDISVVGIDNGNGGSGCPGDPLVITRTWTFNDGCDNSCSVSQTITVMDNEAPTFDQACPVDATVSCNEIPVAAVLTASDNCGDATVTFTEESTLDEVGPCNYTITRTWVAVDDCGNSMTCSQVLTVMDDIDPVCPVPPGPIQVACVDDVPPPPSLTATDECQGDISVFGVDDNGNGGSGCPGDPLVIIRTWTFNDGCDNSCSVSQTITVVDNEAPTFDQACPVDATVSCNEIPTAPVLTASDNCGDATVTFTEESTLDGDGPCNYTITRTWVAVDDCGNSMTCSQVLTVVDDIDPVCPVPPGPIQVACVDDVPPPPSLTATDECQGDISVFGVDDNGNGGSGCPGDPLVIIRTWTFNDGCDNSCSVSQTITVVDDEAPTFDQQCPADMTVDCDNIPSIPTLTASDNCDDDVQLSYSEETAPVVGAGPCTYTITRTWVARDDCGNSATCSQVLTVIDDEAPTFDQACPADVTVSCNAVPQAPTLTATDNCGEATVSFTEESMPIAGIPCGVAITRTWVAADDCGNAMTCSQVITVIDDIEPVCPQPPGPIQVACVDEIPAPPSLTATDECQGDISVFGVDDNGNGGAGCADDPLVIIRTWTFDDNCGNTCSVTQTITVVDDTPPVISCPADVTFECNVGGDIGLPTATDNCDPEPFISLSSEEIIEGECAGEFQVVLTYTAFDACGNSSSCMQTISVIDRTAPQMSVPNDISIQCGDEDTGLATAVDNCSEEVVITYVDLQCSVTVEGFTGDYDLNNWTQTIPDGGDIILNPPTDATLVSADNEGCNGESTLLSITVPEDGKLIFAWNYSTADFGPNYDPFGYRLNGVFVQLTDDNGPNDQSGLAAALVSAGDVFAFDQYSTDCIEGSGATTVIDFFIYTCVEDDPEDACNYDIFRCWSATDDCGNTSYGLQRIHVEDTTPPTISCPDGGVFDCADPLDPMSLGMASATDNCGGVATVMPWINEIHYDNDGTDVGEFFEIAGNAGFDLTGWSVVLYNGAGGIPYNTINLSGIIDDEGDGFGALHFVLPENGLQNGAPDGLALVDDNGVAKEFLSYEGSFTAVGGPADGFMSMDIGVAEPGAIGESLQRTGTGSMGMEFMWTGPVAESPGDLNAGQTVEPTEGGPMISFMDQVIPGQCPQEFVLIRTWTAVDACGNAATCLQTISVEDNEAPSLACPDDVTVECDEDTSPMNTGYAIAVDNCGLQLAIMAWINEFHYDDDGEDINEFIEVAGPAGIDLDGWSLVLYNGSTGAPYNTVNLTGIIPDEMGGFGALAFVLPVNGLQNGSPDGIALVDADGELKEFLSYEGSFDGVGGAADGVTSTDVGVQEAGEPEGNSLQRTGQGNMGGDFTWTGPTAESPGSLNAGQMILSPGVSFVDVISDGNCANEYIITRTWTVFDECENGTNCVQVIAVEDNTPPSITCPDDVTIECDQEAGFVLVNFDGVFAPTVFDDQDEPVETYAGNGLVFNGDWEVLDIASFNVTGLSDPNKVAWNNSGSTGTTEEIIFPDPVAYVSFKIAYATGTDDLTVTSYDSDDAVIDVQVINVGGAAATVQIAEPGIKRVVIDVAVASAGCLDDLAFGLTGFAVAVDNCDENPSIDYSDQIAAGECAHEYTITRTWIAVDDCGNEATCVQTITVEDSTAPTITCPDDATVECDESVSPDNTGGFATATDNCDTAPIVSYADVETPGDCPQEYTITRTWTATDACGNSTSCVQTINVVDTTPPDISCPADVTIECDDPLPTLVASVTDNCSEGPFVITTSDLIISSDCADEYTIIRTFLTADECGNPASCTQTITIVDTTPPDIVCPADATIECGDPIPGGIATATDNCDGDVDVQMISETITEYTGARAWGYVAFSFGPPLNAGDFYAFDVSDGSSTYLGTPSCGGLSPLLFAGEFVGGTFYGLDNNAPQSLVTIAGDGTCNVIGALSGLSAGHVVSGLSHNLANGVTYAMSTSVAATSLYTIDLSNGDLTLVGSIAGVIGGISLVISETGDAYVLDIVSDQIFPLDLTNATVGAGVALSDANGAIDLNNAQDADFDCGVNGEIQGMIFDAGLFNGRLGTLNPATGFFTETAVMDAEVSAFSIDCENAGCGELVTRVFEATDNCGNTSTCVQTIAILDTTDPEPLTCPESVDLGCNPMIPDDLPPILELTTVDDCAGVITAELLPTDIVVFGCQYSMLRTYIAEDNCGNSVSCTQLITWTVDLTPPELTCSMEVVSTYEDLDLFTQVDGLTHNGVTYEFRVGGLNSSDCTISLGPPEQLFVNPPGVEGNAAGELTLLFEKPVSMVSYGFALSTLVEVDPGSTMELYGAGDVLLGTFSAPASNTGFVFVEGFVSGDQTAVKAVITFDNSTAARFLLDNLTYTCPEDLDLGCNPVSLPDPVDVYASDICSGMILADVEVIQDDTTDCLGVLVHQYTATDDCGNSSVCTRTYTYYVSSELMMQCTKPSPISCPEELPDVEATADWLIEQGYADAVGGCDEDLTIIWVGFEPLENDCSLAWTFAFTAEDACGVRADTCYIIVQIYQDFVAPEITCTDVPHLGCNPETIPTAQDLLNGGYVTAIDECGIVTIGFLPPFIETIDGCEYNRAYRFRATDGCGNQSEICTVNVSWTVDVTPPSLTCPDDLVLECDEPIPAPEVATATDDCELVLVTFVGEVGSGDACDSTIVRHYYAVDACGNESTCTQTIRILDTTAPEITCPELLVLECGVDPVPVTTAIVTDNCTEDPFVTYTDEEFETECGPDVMIDGYIKVKTLIVRTFVTRDDCDNTSSCTQHILIRDDTPPSLTCPDDVTIECDQDIDDLELTGEGIAVDLCDPEPLATILLTFLRTDLSDECTMVYERVWGATDECGNGGSSELCSQLITVEDTTPPVISCPADETIECGDDLPTTLATATDNCNTITYTYTDSEIVGNCPMVITRTHYATDFCDNVSSCTQYIYIEDTTAPTVTCPDDLTIECGTPLPAPGATGSDICDEDVEVTLISETTGPLGAFGWGYICGSFSNGNLSVGGFYSFDLSDGLGTLLGTPNCAGGNALLAGEFVGGTYYALENTGPSLVTLAGDGTCTVVGALSGLMAGHTVSGLSHNLATGITYVLSTDVFVTTLYTIDLSDGSLTPVGSIAGVAGGISLMISEIGAAYVIDIVVDQVFPINLANATAGAGVPLTDGMNPINLNFAQDADFDCGVGGQIQGVLYQGGGNGSLGTLDPSTGVFTETAFLGVEVCAFSIDCENAECGELVTRVYEAVDDCGNASTCVQRIAIVDTTPPDIVCPADVTIECDEDVPTTIATATDICDAQVDITYVDEIIVGECEGDVFVDGENKVLTLIVRTHYAIDDCGNVARCTQHIVIRDDTPPEVVCPPAITIDCLDPIDPDFTGHPIVTDNCDPNPQETFVDLVSGDDCVRIITRVWSATDWCGNGLSSNICVQVITILDTTAPSITCPDDVSIECGDPLPTTLATGGDDCNDVVFTYEDADTVGLCPKLIVRTHYATDDCGNQSTCTQHIYLFDNTPPEIDCPADVTIECGIDPLPTDLATADDICNEVTVTYMDEEFPQECEEGLFIEGVDQVVSIIVRTHKATDACGNMSVCTQHIVVRDDTPPAISCPADVTLECDQDINDLELTGVPLVEDICDPEAYATILITFVVDPNPCATVYERIWSATDHCGNGTSSGLCTQRITLVDTTPPVISCPADATIECGDDLPTDFATATDNCNEITYTYSDSDAVGECPMVITRTHYASDLCGNVSSCIQLIYIEDTTAPEISCPALLTVECGDEVPVTMATASDVCDDNLTLTYSDEPLLDADNCSWEIQRTHYAEDNCGNVASCVQVILIIDTTPPVISCPADVTIECDDPLPMSMATATDVCDADPFVTLIDQNFGEGLCSYQVTRTFQATDACGLTSTCVQTITVEDTTAPEVSCPEDIDLGCEVITCLTFDEIEVTPDDSVLLPTYVAGGVTITLSAYSKGGVPQDVGLFNSNDPHPGCEDLGSPNTLYGGPGLNANDPDGFAPSNNKDVGNVLIVQNPTVDFPDDYFLSDTLILEFSEPVFIESLDALDFEEAQALTGGGIFLYNEDGGLISFTGFNAALGNDNSLEEMALKTPGVKVLKVYYGTTTPGSGGLGGLCFIFEPCDTEDVVVTDNCNEWTVACADTTIAVSDCLTEVIRTYTAEDFCGNVNEDACSQTISYTTDGEQPDIICPDDITIGCEDPLPPIDPDAVVVLDNCSADGDIFVTWVEDIVDGEGCDEVIRRIYRAEDECGNEALCAQFITREVPPDMIQLSAHIMLSGPMEPGQTIMYTDINDLLPGDQPYTMSPYNYNGDEHVDVFPDNIVDWVLVDLRDVVTMEIIAVRAALVTAEGTIVDLDGVSPLSFNATPDQYYVVVCHRNHLDVLSDTPVDFTGGGMGTLDLALGNAGMIEVEPGMWAMVKGDVNTDGIVNNTDMVVLAPFAAVGYVGQYLEYDVNMDGVVNNTDLVILAPFAAIGYVQSF